MADLLTTLSSGTINLPTVGNGSMGGQCATGCSGSGILGTLLGGSSVQAGMDLSSLSGQFGGFTVGPFKFTLTPPLTYQIPIPWSGKFANFMKFLETVQKILKIIMIIKKVLDILRSLNFNGGDMPMPSCALPGLGYDLPYQYGFSPQAMTGLGMVSQLSPGDDAMIGNIANMAAVPKPNLVSLVTGDIQLTTPIDYASHGMGQGLVMSCDTFTKQDAVATLEAVGKLGEMLVLMQELSAKAESMNEGDITVDVVRATLATTVTSYANDSAESVYFNIDRLQASYGLPISELMTQVAGAGTIQINGIHPNLMQALGINMSPTQLADQVFGTIDSLTNSAQEIAGLLNSLPTDKLQELTDGIYNINHIQAKISKFRTWLSHVSHSFTTLGFSVDIDVGKLLDGLGSQCS